MSREGWKTTSGLIDDFDIIIQQSWYGHNPKFDNGKATLLHLRGPASINGEVVSEEETLLFGTGKEWKVTDGGTTATHPSGKTQFNDQTSIGRLINSIAEVADDEVMEELVNRGDPTNAEVFLGLKLHLERKPFTYKDQNDGNKEKVYEVLLATAVEGFDDEVEATPAKKTPAKKPGATKAPAKAAPGKKAPPKKAAKSLRDALVELASGYDDTDEAHSEFIEAAYSDEFPRSNELTEDEEVAAEVLEYQSPLWVEAHPE